MLGLGLALGLLLKAPSSDRIRHGNVGYHFKMVLDELFVVLVSAGAGRRVCSRV